MLFDSRRIAADEAVLQPSQLDLDGIGAAFKRRFADARQSCIRFYFDENQVAPAERELVDGEAGDLDTTGNGRSRDRRGGGNREPLAARQHAIASAIDSGKSGIRFRL